MIDENGKCKVFLVEEFYMDNTSCLISVHSTSEGADKWMNANGFRYMTCPPSGSGWYNLGWYRVNDAHTEWYFARVSEMEVRE